SKAAQIRALWPEIRTALDNGHSLQAVCDCLAADGITLTVQSLGSYIGRIRRTSGRPDQSAITAELDSSNSRPKHIQPVEVEAPIASGKQPADPLANVRARQGKRPAFDYRPELA